MRYFAIATLILLTAAPVETRPNDSIFVLQAPVDGVKDSLTVALSDDVFVTYDLKTCSVRRAWRGSLSIESEPGNSGPQVKTNVTDIFYEASGGARWELLDPNGAGDAVVESSVRYVGYEILAGRVYLNYLLEAEDLHVEFRESPKLLDKTDMDLLWMDLTNEKGQDSPFALEGITAFERTVVLPKPPGNFELCLLWNRSVGSITSWPGFHGRTDQRRERKKNWEPLILGVHSGQARLIQMIVLAD